MVKILSIVGARPQFVKLAPIAAECGRQQIEHVIVHTGQHYDPMLSEVFFTDLGIPAPDVHLGVGSGSHGQQTGAILSALDPILEQYNPDWVLVYGDTNSTLAGALSAVKLHLPVAHLEAGLRSFNRYMPEEINRILTDHASDLLLTPTLVGAKNLEQEGLGHKTVVVGDVMTDVLYQTRDLVSASAADIARVLQMAPGGYYLATIHRAENTDDPARLRRIMESLAGLDKTVVLLAHPRLRDCMQRYGIEVAADRVSLRAPLAYPQLVAAALASAGVVTDSGGLQKEAFLLQVACTTVRTETEWVETLADGWNVLVEPGEQMVRAVKRLRPEPTAAKPYGDGRAARQVIDALVARGARLSSGREIVPKTGFFGQSRASGTISREK